MGYIPYQMLNGGKPVTSKGKVRKRLRRQGRGKGGCTPAAPVIQAKTAIPKGKINPRDSYVGICHNGHRKDYYPKRLKVGDEVKCPYCNETFIAEKNS